MLSKEETTIILDAPEWRLVLASLVTTSKVWASLSAAGGDAADHIRAEAYQQIRQKLVQQLQQTAARR